MNGATAIVMEDEGQIVIPAKIRERWNWDVGTVLLPVETEDGLLLTERGSLLEQIRNDLAGAPLVAELLSDRREEAAREDADE